MGGDTTSDHVVKEDLGERQMIRDACVEKEPVVRLGEHVPGDRQTV